MAKNPDNMSPDDFKMALRKLGYIEDASYYKINAIAEFLGVSRRQVYRLIAGEASISVAMARMLELAIKDKRK